MDPNRTEPDQPGIRTPEMPSISPNTEPEMPSRRGNPGREIETPQVPEPEIPVQTPRPLPDAPAEPDQPGL